LQQDGAELRFRQGGLELLKRLDHLVLAWFQHAVQAAQHRERQHYVAVFVVFEDAAQNIVGHLPDEVGPFLEVAHRRGSCFVIVCR
jgi:hypothetical protein